MTPTVSILLPSRNRPELLKKSIASFHETWSGTHLFEVLVLADSNDEATLSLENEFSDRWGYTNVHYMIQSKLKQYRNIHRYMNMLAAWAAGNFLWTLNDDARVLTQDWDLLITRTCPDPVRQIMLLGTITRTQKALSFPILSRALYEVLGRVSPTAHSDCYLHALCNCAGINVDTGITMWHAEDGKTGLTEVRDVMETWNLYRGEESCHQFERDLNKLEAALKRPVQHWSPKLAPVNPL